MNTITDAQSESARTPQDQKVVLLVEATVTPRFLDEVLSSASKTRA